MLWFSNACTLPIKIPFFEASHLLGPAHTEEEEIDTPTWTWTRGLDQFIIRPWWTGVFAQHSGQNTLGVSFKGCGICGVGSGKFCHQCTRWSPPKAGHLPPKAATNCNSNPPSTLICIKSFFYRFLYRHISGKPHHREVEDSHIGWLEKKISDRRWSDQAMCGEKLLLE